MPCWPRAWRSTRAASQSQAPQLLVLYEDNFNFLSKMCLGAMRQRRLRHDRVRPANAAHASSWPAPMPAMRRMPYLNAGADAVLAGEGLEALAQLVQRLDANPTLEP